MSVIRSVKNRENPYVQINRVMFDEPNLSLKAKGFIGYCLSKPDHWQFYVEQLASVLKEKKTAIYSAIKEAIAEGYCIKFQLRDAKGKVGKCEYIVSDSKEEIIRIKEELKEFLPLSGFPLAGNPLAGNQPLLKNKAKANNETTNPEEKKPKKKEIVSSFLDEIEELKDSNLDASQRKTLSKKYTKEQIIKALKAIDLISYDSHFAILTSAIEGDYQPKGASQEEKKEEIKKLREDLISKNRAIAQKLYEENNHKLDFSRSFKVSDNMIQIKTIEGIQSLPLSVNSTLEILKAHIRKNT